MFSDSCCVWLLHPDLLYWSESMISSKTWLHPAEKTIKKKKRYSLFTHLWKIKCTLTVDLQGWGGWAGLHLNKHELAGGKLTARRLKVKLSRVIWLAMMHSMYSQPVLLVLSFLFLPSFTLFTVYYPLAQKRLKDNLKLFSDYFQYQFNYLLFFMFGL